MHNVCTTRKLHSGWGSVSDTNCRDFRHVSSSSQDWLRAALARTALRTGFPHVARSATSREICLDSSSSSARGATHPHQHRCVCRRPPQGRRTPVRRVRFRSGQTGQAWGSDHRGGPSPWAHCSSCTSCWSRCCAPVTRSQRVASRCGWNIRHTRELPRFGRIFARHFAENESRAPCARADARARANVPRGHHTGRARASTARQTTWVTPNCSGPTGAWMPARWRWSR